MRKGQFYLDVIMRENKEIGFYHDYGVNHANGDDVDYASRILNKQLHIQKFEFSALVILPQQKIRIISNITIPEYSKYIQLIILFYFIDS